MTERDAQVAIWRMIGNQSEIMAPNYTPRSWWECDVFAVTKAGYGVEYEIKTSVRDFEADARKRRTRRLPFNHAAKTQEERHPKIVEVKHELLAAHDQRGPSRFFYVVPDEMRETFEPLLPAWAGLVTVRHRQRDWWIAHAMKTAPRLHNTKVEDSVTAHMASVFYYRFWRLLARESA